MDVSYNVSEVDGLTEAKRIITGLTPKVVYCHPAWLKLYHVDNYLEKRQHEVLDEALADPQAERIAGGAE